MRAFGLIGIALAATAGMADAAVYGGRTTSRGEAIAASHAVARSRAFASASSVGRSDFRYGSYTRFNSPSAAWGFQHTPRVTGGYGAGAGYRRTVYPGRRYGYGSYGRYNNALGYGLAAGAPYGDYGYTGDAGSTEAYGPEAPYGGFAPPNGYPGRSRGVPLSQGFSASGEGAYAYGYNGYAQTPDLPAPYGQPPAFVQDGYPAAYPAPCGC